jgi:hypothetical protein
MALTQVDQGLLGTYAQYTGFKNRLINSAMVIDQRNAGALMNPMADSTYYLDRWRASSSQASKLSIGQNAGSVTPPAGFTNYMGFTSLSAYSITSTDIFGIAQNIEGFNVADLGWGTANAQPVTLSFWVRSSLTGTFGGSFRNSASSRSYPISYTISSANTWEYKTITVAGDTSGTWLTTNGIGILLFFSLGSGSTYSGTAGSWSGSVYTSSTGATSVVGTNGATFYITGVQLEKGSTATSFDYRPYGTELQLCQRYYQRTSFDTGDYPFSSGYAYTNNTMAGYLPLAVPMRATPTATIIVNMCLRGGGLGAQTLSSLGGISYSNGIGSGITVLCNPTTSGTSLTTATVYVLCNQASGGFSLSAEL